MQYIPRLETQAAGCSALLQTCEAAVKQHLPLPADMVPQLASLLTPPLKPAVRQADLLKLHMSLS